MLRKLPLGLVFSLLPTGIVAFSSTVLYNFLYHQDQAKLKGIYIPCMIPEGCQMQPGHGSAIIAGVTALVLTFLVVFVFMRLMKVERARALLAGLFCIIFLAIEVFLMTLLFADKYDGNTLIPIEFSLIYIGLSFIVGFCLSRPIIEDADSLKIIAKE